jgi:predicted nucleotidyltransferase
MRPSIDRVKQVVSKPCEQFGVKRLEVFGSIARGQADAGSDLDQLRKIREWRDVIAFRNKLAHCYDHINPTLVWRSIVVL